jgi:putative ABC transport system permease protein
MWAWDSVETLWQDLRYGLRQLRRSPGFTIVAVCTLALGIGANSAMFAVVNSVLLRPLPYPRPDQLVMIWKMRFPAGGLGASPADFLAWRSQTHSFSDMAAYVAQSFNLTGRGEPEQIDGLRVTPSFFSLLGVQANSGRTFLASEEQPGSEHVAVISARLGQTRFGNDRKGVGSTMLLDGERYTIIGALPSSFVFHEHADVFIPLTLNRASANWGQNFLTVLARLKPGFTQDHAQAEMNVVAARLRGEAGETSGINPSVVSMRSEVIGDAHTLLLPLFGAVACVLLITCTTLATLLLARATARKKEMAVRTALGAGRARLILQMLTESVTLALLGGMLGLVLAHWLPALLVAAGPKALARVQEINLDFPVPAFTLGVCILTGILFGLAPALRASRVQVEAALREDTGGSAGPSRQILRSALIVVQVAVAMVLLTGAGLLLNSYVRLVNVDPGFRPDHVLTMRLTLPAYSYRDEHQVTRFYEGVLDRIKTLYGVQSAGLADSLPLGRGVEHVGFSFRADSNLNSERLFQLPYGEAWDTRGLMWVSSEYLATMGTPLLAGRPFAARDNQEGAPPVAIVNRTFAREFSPHLNPLGRRIHLSPHDLWCTIVGVSEDMKNGGLGDDQLWLSKPPFGTIYVPHALMPAFMYEPPWDLGRSMYLVVRTTGEPLRMTDAVRRAVWSVDANQPVAEVKTMEERLMDSVASRRLGMLPFVVFATIAWALAVGGIYGLVAYSVAHRTREMGIRIALGASRSNVLRLVVQDGAVLIVTGILIGGVGTHWLNRVLANQLYAIKPTDALTFAAASMLLGGVALFASYIPARRATKVDPIVALRYE